MDKTYCKNNNAIFEDYYCEILCADHGPLGIGPVRKYCEYKSYFQDCSAMDAKCVEHCNPRVECHCNGDVVICEKVECLVPMEGSQAACELRTVEEEKDCNEYDRVYCDNNVLMSDDYYCDNGSCLYETKIVENCSAGGGYCIDLTKSCFYPLKTPSNIPVIDPSTIHVPDPSIIPKIPKIPNIP